MMRNIIEMLKVSEHCGVSKNVDIAKGVNKLPTSFRIAFEQRKREAQWQ